MAVVIKNTFLDVAEHKFLYWDEPCCAATRSRSLPRQWKPTATSNRPISSPMSIDASLSPRSNLSFYSAVESSELHSSSKSGDWDLETDVAEVPARQFSCMTPTSSLASPRDVTEIPFRQFSCMTPTSSVGSPRDFAKIPSMQFSCMTPTSSLGSPREDAQWASSWTSELDNGSCYMSNCNLEESDSPSSAVSGTNKLIKLGNISDSSASIENNIIPESLAQSFVWRQFNENEEPENEPETCMECVEGVYGSLDTRTRLKVEAPAFQPAPKDTRIEAVLSCLHMALASCGQVHDIKTERGPAGVSSTWISAELQRGPCASARSYDVIHLAKQSLDAITARLPTVTLLSARVQREDSGYSLRSSMACIPDHAQDCMCWDLFRKGHCPRRSSCRWYHPQDSDIARIKISIRYGEDVSDVGSEDQPKMSSSDARYKISLGALVE